MDKKTRREVIVGLVCIFLALVIFWLTYGFKGGHYGGPLASATFYPRLISSGIIGLSIILIIDEVIIKKKIKESKRKDEKVTEEDTERGLESRWRIEKINLVRMIAGALICIFYTIFLDVVGYILATPVMLFLFFWVLGVKGWIKIAGLSLGITFAMYIVFAKLLDVVLPVGILSLP